LNGNPLTEAITVFTDKDSIYDELTHIPVISQNIWDLPDIYQQVELKKIDRVHIPVPYIYALYNKFMSLILDGYSKYNPFSAEVNCLQMEAAIAARKDKFLNGEMLARTTAPSVLIHGESGSGKTTAIRRALSIMPQVIEHENYSGKSFKQDQLVWLSFDLPSTASIKGLALNFFAAVDLALGTNYYDDWKDKSQRTVERHLGQMQVIVLTHHLGIVHLDELQFMLDYGKSKNAPSFITIEALFNKLGIPIILSCTSTGRNMLLNDEKSVDFTSTRRLLNDREFKFSTYRLEDPFFNEMFEALFPPILSTDGDIPNREFKQKFHFYTCGLPAIMTRLAYLHHETIAQLRVKSPSKAQNYQTNDINRLGSVFKNQFSLISRALQNLRSGNIVEYEKTLAVANGGKGGFTKKEIKEAIGKRRKGSAKELVIDKLEVPGIPPIVSAIDKDAMSEFINGDANG
jgi:energy-coupling factor transporter ATP-binding protein EcfA2